MRDTSIPCAYFLLSNINNNININEIRVLDKLTQNPRISYVYFCIKW